MIWLAIFGGWCSMTVITTMFTLMRCTYRGDQTVSDVSRDRDDLFAMMFLSFILWYIILPTAILSYLTVCFTKQRESQKAKKSVQQHVWHPGDTP